MADPQFKAINIFLVFLFNLLTLIVGESMARFSRKKENERKLTVEERLLEIWNQQVFFIKKKFPQAETEILKIQKSYTRKTDFCPTEEATNALRDLYASLNIPSSQGPSPTA